MASPWRRAAIDAASPAGPAPTMTRSYTDMVDRSRDPANRLTPSYARRRFLRLPAAASCRLSAGGALLAPAAPAVQRDAAARPLITSRRPERRRRARSRHRLVPDRPAGAACVVRYATTDAPDRRARARQSAPTSADDDFTARARPDRPARRASASSTRCSFEGAGRRAERSRCAARSGRRPASPAPVRIAWGGDVLRPGLGHRRGPRRHGHLRRACAPRARSVHPLRRPDLRRPADPAATVRSTTARCGSNLVDGRRSARSPRRSTEFRGRYRYNLRDAHLRAFNAEVPMVAQWDDHEVLEQLVPGPSVLGDTGTPRGYTREATSTCSPARATAGVLRATRRSRPAAAAAAAAVYRWSAAGRSPTCSCSTAAQLSRPELRQPAGAWPARTRRCWAAAQRAVARGGAGAIARRRGRSSPAISRSAWSCPTARCRKASPTAIPRDARPRARDRRAALGAEARAGSATCSSSPPTCTTPPRTATTRRARPSPTSIRSGSSSPGRCTPAPFGPEPRSTRRSARGRAFAAPAPKPNRPPSDGLQFFGLCRNRSDDARRDGDAARARRPGDLHAGPRAEPSG